jgi:acyl carrier protein
MAIPSHVDPVAYTAVREAFAEALGLDEDEVHYDSKVIEDLGAESLDFLDIVFRLERAFDIKIPRGGIEQAARSGADGAYEVGGVLTPSAVAELRAVMPEVPEDEWVEGLRVSQVPELFRVATFYNIVVKLVAEQHQPLEAAAAG